MLDHINLHIYVRSLSCFLYFSNSIIAIRINSGCACSNAPSSILSEPSALACRGVCSCLSFNTKLHQPSFLTSAGTDSAAGTMYGSQVQAVPSSAEVDSSIFSKALSAGGFPGQPGGDVSPSRRTEQPCGTLPGSCLGTRGRGGSPHAPSRHTPPS